LARPEADTWHEGRFLERWADPEAVAGLEGVFARYDPADIARALRAGAALFERLERDVAGRLGIAAGIRCDELRRHLVDILR
jgi:aminoglycoside 6-adenylyltransferase